MSILIKDMEMPTSCHECVAGYGGCCYIAPAEADGICSDHGRADFCPLVEIPPHGRLIDADELFKEMEHKGWFDNADRDIAEDLVLATPTIIESTIGQLNSDSAVNEANANTSNAFNALDCVSGADMRGGDAE